MNLSQWPLLESDSKKKPGVFQWNGSLPRTEVEAWMRSSKHKVPAFLIDLWVETGGGDLFESESILTPIKVHSFSDGVDEINDWHHSQGLPNNYLVFQKGLFLSAVKLAEFLL